MSKKPPLQNQRFKWWEHVTWLVYVTIHIYRYNEENCKNDKEGQAHEMLNLAYAIATDGSKKDIPLIDGKYVRTPYHKVTLDNVEDY